MPHNANRPIRLGQYASSAFFGVMLKATSNKRTILFHQLSLNGRYAHSFGTIFAFNDKSPIRDIVIIIRHVYLFASLLVAGAGHQPVRKTKGASIGCLVALLWDSRYRDGARSQKLSVVDLKNLTGLRASRHQAIDRISLEVEVVKLQLGACISCRSENVQRCPA